MRVSRLAVGLGLLILLVAATPRELPPPGEVGSHARYLEALRESEASFAAELLARYERRIAEAPDDAVAAVERCSFLAAAFRDSVTGENAREAERAACVEEVESRFADDPAARIFAIEERFGEDARAAAEAFLEQPPPGTTPAQLATVHVHLSRALAFEDEPGAADHAEQAMQLDGSLDLRALIAEERIAQEDLDGARTVLLDGLLETRLGAELERKASLLLDVDAFDAALSALRELERRGEALQRPDLYPRALAAAGEIDAARDAFARLVDEQPDAEALRAHFEFELEHGDARSARAAFDALEAQAFEEDFPGFDRVSLFLAHPGARWTWTEAMIAFGILAGAAFLVSLVPALWILPIVWAGLGRERGAAALGGFTLRHAWTASAVYLVAEAFSALAFFGSDAETPAGLARYMLFSSLATLAGILLVVRRRGVALFAPGAWSGRRTLAVAFGVACLLYGGASLLAYATGLEAGDPGVEELVRAVDTSYGLGASLLLVAGVVPIVEELLFRGVLFSAFERHLSQGWANFAQAALFGIAHFHAIGTPFAFALGLAAGWMTRRSGSLRPALALHVLGNAASCVATAFSS